MVSDVVSSSVVQSSYPLLLFGIYLCDYGGSFRDVPASDKSGGDDDHQSDGKGDSGSESSVEAREYKQFWRCILLPEIAKGLLCYWKWYALNGLISCRMIVYCHVL